MGELILAADADLVCFCDPSIAPKILARRAEHGLLERTQVIPGELEALLDRSTLAEVTEARRRHPLLNGSPSKDTPLYTMLGYLKFELLERVIEAKPFGARHVAWIDFGVAHVAETRHHRQDRVFWEIPDEVRILQMRPLDGRLVDDRDHHLSYRWGHFAAGLISGASECVAVVCKLVRDELRGALDDGYAPLDEQLLDLVVAARPELFSFHHGDYDHITENYRRLRGSADNLLFQLRWWRSREAWGPASVLAEHIVQAVASGTLADAPSSLASLLEECFLAAYYAHPPDQRPARAAAHLYADLARRDPEFREEFLRHEIRVRTNFSFLEEPVEF